MSKPFYTNVSVSGNHVYYRGIENGRRVQRKLSYAPTLFVPSKTPNTTVTWKDLQGNPVEPMKFTSIYDAKDFIKRYKDVKGFTIYGQQNFATAFIAEQHPEEIMEWDLAHVVTAYIDIEVDTEYRMPDVDTCLNPITAVTIKFSNDPQYHVFGCNQYTPHRPDITWYQCVDECNLVTRFMSLWRDRAPDIITGWSVKTFDIPYLVGRIIMLLGEDQAQWLSPWGKVNRREEKSKFGKPITTYQLLGISTLDYFQLYNKYAPKSNQESYKLDYIAHVELGERKVNYEEHETLHNLYRDNFQKFIEYNIHDVELVEMLNAKGRLVDMAVLLAYDNKTNYEDAFFQVRMWDAITYNHLNRKYIVIPPKKGEEKDEAYEGAYVKDPQTGLFEWLMSLDLDSLYPHLIMQYNLSPETLIDPKNYTPAMKAVLEQGVSVNALLQQKITLDGLEGCTLTPNGQFFDTTRVGFLSEIMDTMYAARVHYKNKQLELELELEEIKGEMMRRGTNFPK
jgi:DNA polymerase elongation subunit (family B)